MGLYDIDTEQYIGRCEIPDEVRGSIVPQSFCDPDDGLELDLSEGIVFLSPQGLVHSIGVSGH